MLVVKYEPFFQKKLSMPFALLETLAHVATVAGPFLPIAGALTATISVAGLAPRLAPRRALWIGVRSRFGFNKTPLSVRATDLKIIRAHITKKSWGQKYLVVIGDKGVGKSCLLDTATNKTAGIIRIKVSPGESMKKIVENALRGLTELSLNIVDVGPYAKKVLFWYKLFTRTTPVIVINAAEREIGDPYPQITAAVRHLTDDIGLRVIVDSSPNSVSTALLSTKREEIIEIKPMAREMIWSVPELQPLFKMTKQAGLDNVVWSVLGGNPFPLLGSVRLD